jgi:hypothetical protein
MAHLQRRIPAIMTMLLHQATTVKVTALKTDCTLKGMWLNTGFEVSSDIFLRSAYMIHNARCTFRVTLSLLLQYHKYSNTEEIVGCASLAAYGLLVDARVSA